MFLFSTGYDWCRCCKKFDAEILETPAFRAYALEWRFRHPTGDDLVATFLRELGARPLLEGTGPEGQAVNLDLADYFQQALHSVAAVDFGLLKARTRGRAGAAGWHRDEHGALALQAATGDRDLPPAELPEAEVEGVVVVHRIGEFRVPVELEVEFETGAAVRTLWDGQARYRVFTWPGRRVRSARLVPPGKVLLGAPRAGASPESLADAEA